MTFTMEERHDPKVLEAASLLIRKLTGDEVAHHLHELVEKNESWRGRRCLNLIAAESPTSPATRDLLSAEVGTRASGGHIGRNSRCFAGMRYIDELEAACVELIRELFGAAFADHRLLGGMAGCTVTYAALIQPGDTVMSLPPPAGGDTSGRADGPAGIRGAHIIDIPYDLAEFTVDLDAFHREATRHRPALISLNQTMALFPLPVREMKEIVAQWGGRLYFDGAHQAGLIAGGCHPNPLDEGADILTGSSGKTFSGPQGGIIAWNDVSLTTPVTNAIFPVLTGSHQINRVAALAMAAAEMRTYGAVYMRQVVTNARALATALDAEGFTVLARHRGYTRTHQVMVDARPWGGGLATAQRLEQANIIVNKMLLPSDPDIPEAEPGGIRLGTVEVTRLGMDETDMATIAALLRRLLLEQQDPAAVRPEVEKFRSAYQTLHYCFPERLPGDRDVPMEVQEPDGYPAPPGPRP
ncbi:MAG: serine hydroxymethyltransferase [Pseudonocardiaceae bacterium]